MEAGSWTTLARSKVGSGGGGTVLVLTDGIIREGGRLGLPTMPSSLKLRGEKPLRSDLGLSWPTRSVLPAEIKVSRNSINVPIIKVYILKKNRIRELKINEIKLNKLTFSK